jgi:hypothetical protein
MIDTIKKTRTELENLYGLFTSLKDETFSPKFSFFVLRNIGFLEAEVSALNETRVKLHESIKEYDTERMELAASMADTDESGNPVIDNGAYQIINNLGDFQIEFAKLQEKHKDSVATFNALEKGLVDLLNEEVDQKIMKISYLDIPEDTFSIDKLFKFKDFFKETEEELDELIMG